MANDKVRFDVMRSIEYCKRMRNDPKRSLSSLAVIFEIQLALEAGLVPPEAESKAFPKYKRNQSCGCVLCICNDDIQCHGCGAKSCGLYPKGEHPPFQTNSIEIDRVVAESWVRVGSYSNSVTGSLLAGEIKKALSEGRT